MLQESLVSWWASLLCSKAAHLPASLTLLLRSGSGGAGSAHGRVHLMAFQTRLLKWQGKAVFRFQEGHGREKGDYNTGKNLK